ncbi:MAG: aminopeptidase N [Halioglobus sp.]|jgi:aminopeptidase N
MPNPRQFRILKWLLLTLAIGSPACTSSGLPAPAVLPGVSWDLAQHRSKTLSKIHYRLRFEIPEDSREDIDALLQLSFHLNSIGAPLQLDFTGPANSISKVVCNGIASAFEVHNQHIVIPESVLRIGGNNIEIVFFAGQSSLNRNSDFLYTLFVPDRARTAFPLFDQPDLKAKYDLTLVVPLQWTALSNAPLLSVSHEDGTARYQFSTTDLTSSYLFSFVAGKFKTVTRTRQGRSMTLLHRETDDEKVSRNLDAIFELHWRAIDEMEAYTGIEYPFQKFDFALIPSFQYGGMEHVGAVQYRASTLLLDESPSEDLLLNRANLIAHETAHMWFGNLVTMQWFDDVWTKEVFANFMAAKLVNPSFPNVNHELNFLLRHSGPAHAVDRSSGANPIRQKLSNLDQAGNLYGSIIYNKAPIMMRQLEMLLGEQQFRQGMRQYLKKYAFGNANWQQLIQILDSKTDTDLSAWSEVWVNTPGRPHFKLTEDAEGVVSVQQIDPASQNRIWPQQFSLSAENQAVRRSVSLNSSTNKTKLEDPLDSKDARILFNSDGLGYGVFPADIEIFQSYDNLTELERGSALLNYFENLLEGRANSLPQYYSTLLTLVPSEHNQLLSRLILSQLIRIHHSLLSDRQQSETQIETENILWQQMLDQQVASSVKTFFNAYAAIVSSPAGLKNLYDVWTGKLSPTLLKLAENDYIALAELLAIRLPESSEAIVATQLKRIENPDNRRRFEFIAPTLSAEPAARDAFFESLTDERQRNTESWVLDALSNLHHPSRVSHSHIYVLPSLELLEELQRTGDIFFPAAWLNTTLKNHHSASAIATVEKFLQDRPHYNPQLRMKVLQAVDFPRRAVQLRAQ